MASASMAVSSLTFHRFFFGCFFCRKMKNGWPWEEKSHFALSVGYFFLGLTWVELGLNGLYWVILGFTRFYRVLLGLTGFYWVLLGFTGFYRVSPNFTGFYQILLGFIRFYRVLPVFTGFYWVLLNFTAFYWVFLRRPTPLVYIVLYWAISDLNGLERSILG